MKNYLKNNKNYTLKHPNKMIVTILGCQTVHTSIIYLDRCVRT